MDSEGQLEEALSHLEAIATGRIPNPGVALPLGTLQNRLRMFEKTVAVMVPVTKFFPQIADGRPVQVCSWFCTQFT